MNNIIIDDNNREFINDLNKLANDYTFKNLLIIGNVGIGKTFLVKNIFNKEKFKDSYYIDESEFKQKLISGVLRLKTADEFACDNRLFPLEMLVRRELVIYDDYGIADPSTSYIEKVKYWIDKRYEKENFKTIFISNMSLDEIKERDQRIYSRIVHNCKILILEGYDKREELADIKKYKIN